MGGQSRKLIRRKGGSSGSSTEHRARRNKRQKQAQPETPAVSNRRDEEEEENEHEEEEEEEDIYGTSNEQNEDVCENRSRNSQSPPVDTVIRDGRNSQSNGPTRNDEEKESGEESSQSRKSTEVSPTGNASVSEMSGSVVSAEESVRKAVAMYTNQQVENGGAMSEDSLEKKCVELARGTVWKSMKFVLSKRQELLLMFEIMRLLQTNEEDAGFEHQWEIGGIGNKCRKAINARRNEANMKIKKKFKGEENVNCTWCMV